MKSILILFLFAVLFSPIRAQYDIFITNSSEAVPTRTVEYVSDGIIVTYTFDKVNFRQDPLYSSCYFFYFKGFYQSDVAGRPSIPFHHDSFTVPVGHTASVALIDSVYTCVNMPVAPARPPLSDNSNEQYTTSNVPSVGVYAGHYPESVIAGKEEKTYRGIHILDLCIAPIKFDNQYQNTYLFSYLKYKITFTPEGEGAGTITPAQLRRTQSFLSKNTINGYNFPYLASVPAMSPQADIPVLGAGYLIITTPKYIEAANRFAEWKRILGFNVVTDIRGTWVSDSVKESVQCYNEQLSLEHLLIIGDSTDVPPEYHDFGNDLSCITDYHYGCLTHNDIQSIHVGRLPVSTPEQANIVVDKIIRYESQPPLDASFYNNGLHCAYFETSIIGADTAHVEKRRFVHTCEEILHHLSSNFDYSIHRAYYADSNANPTYWNGLYYYPIRDPFSFSPVNPPIPSYLRKPSFLWNATKDSIQHYIDEGVFYILYRDHGTTTMWEHPQFSINDINNLNNQNKLPIVFSLCCDTGNFSSDSSFVKSFLKKEGRGAVAIFAATDTSISGYTDIYTLSMFNAIWPNPQIESTILSGVSNLTSPSYTLGDIMLMGKASLKQAIWPSHTVQDGSYLSIIDYHNNLFHCFGDPSMEMYTAKPSVFDSVSIIRNANDISVSLQEDATITFYNRQTGIVHTYKGSSTTYNTSDKNVVVSINAHNKIPHIDSPDIYLQNDTINGDVTIRANSIIAGNHVTNDKPTGNVVFDGGRITIIGNSVTLDAGTEIKLGTEFTIKNNE